MDPVCVNPSMWGSSFILQLSFPKIALRIFFISWIKIILTHIVWTLNVPMSPYSAMPWIYLLLGGRGYRLCDDCLLGSCDSLRCGQGYWGASLLEVGDSLLKIMHIVHFHLFISCLPTLEEKLYHSRLVIEVIHWLRPTNYHKKISAHNW